jgi:hypothetical protein
MDDVWIPLHANPFCFLYKLFTPGVTARFRDSRQIVLALKIIFQGGAYRGKTR